MDAIETLSKSFETHQTAVMDGLKKAAETGAVMSARLSDVEQKLVRGDSYGGPEIIETWGAQVAKSEEVKWLRSDWRGRVRIGVKAVMTSATTDAAGSAGDLLVPHRPAGVIGMPRRTLRMRQLFAAGRTTGNAIEWPKQTQRATGAATQTEGETKGQSDLRFDLVTWPVRTIAHFTVASKQILDDVPALQSIIDSELRYGLADVEDHQLLNGSGSGTDLLGVYTGATAFAPPFEAVGVDWTLVDILLQGIAQVDNADFEADGIVLNPLDWRRIQSIKDESGRYIGGGPFSAEQVARLWALPVATTKAMSAGDFMVGAFQQGAQIFDRQEATVEISTEDGDNFRRNLVTVRAEERLALVVKHASAFVKGNFETALGL